MDTNQLVHDISHFDHIQEIFGEHNVRCTSIQVTLTRLIQETEGIQIIQRDLYMIEVTL